MGNPLVLGSRLRVTIIKILEEFAFRIKERQEDIEFALDKQPEAYDEHEIQAMRDAHTYNETLLSRIQPLLDTLRGEQQ